MDTSTCKRFGFTHQLFAILTTFVAIGSSAFAASSSVDPNQLLAFKKLYVEPAQDNVDGAFREIVERAYKEIFLRNPRFEIVNSVSASDSRLRTVIRKMTSGTELEVSLLVGEGEVFSTEKTQVRTSDEHDITDALKALLKTTLKRIPFYGTVTGRDGNQLTFDIGEAHGLRQGDTIQISRIDQVKRHPLLKSIVDVQLVPVGAAAVDQVEESMAFGHVSNEVVSERISRGHKVTAIEARGNELSPGHASVERRSRRDQEGDDEEDLRPQLGYLGLGLFIGSFSSSTSVTNGTVTYSGSTFNPGADLFGELWLTKNWFADFSFGGSTMSYSQSDTSQPSTSKTGTDGHTTEFSLSGGYRYLPMGTIDGPQIFAKLGYHRFGWNIGANANDLQSSKTYSGLNLGLGGMLPIRGPAWGLMLNVNVMLFPSLSEDAPKFLADPSATGVNATFGLYHFVTPQVAVRAALSFAVYSGEAGSGNASTSQSQIGFAPSIAYYF